MPNTSTPTIRDAIYAPSIPELIRQMRRKGQLGFFMDAWRDYGDLAHLKLGPRELFLVVHPDHVRHVNVSHADNYDKLETYTWCASCCWAMGWWPAAASCGAASAG